MTLVPNYTPVRWAEALESGNYKQVAQKLCRMITDAHGSAQPAQEAWDKARAEKMEALAS